MWHGACVGNQEREVAQNRKRRLPSPKSLRLLLWPGHQRSPLWFEKSSCYLSPSVRWPFISTPTTIGIRCPPERQSIGSSSKKQREDCRSFATTSRSRRIE